MGKFSRDADLEGTFSVLARTSSLALYRMCQSASKRRTDEGTHLFVRPSIRPFIYLSLVHYVCQGRPSYGGNEPRYFTEI